MVVVWHAVFKNRIDNKPDTAIVIERTVIRPHIRFVSVRLSRLYVEFIIDSDSLSDGLSDIRG